MSKVSPLSDRELFLAAANATESAREFLEHLGLRAAGGNYAAAKKWSEFHGIDIPSGVGRVQTRKAQAVRRLAHEDVFCINSKAKREHVKTRLRKIWNTWLCAICGIGEEWNGLPLVLQLDHINGVFNDNRLENLRVLCPNCHSQTENFSGKNSNSKR